MRKPAALLVMVMLASVAGLTSQQVFRSTTSVVIVDVLVRNGKSLATGLTVKDFRIFDDGVPQTIDEVVAEQQPVDLTLLIDSSGSTSSAMERMREQATRIAALLRTDDRVRVLAFATAIEEIVPLQHGIEAVFLDRSLPRGETSLNDALIHALYLPVEPARRHLIVAFTDGKDTSSVASSVTVNQVARRANAVLHLVIDGPLRPPTTPLSSDLRLLKEAAEVTSGELHESGRFSSAVEALSEVFAWFRQSYVLRYRPQGVSETGWHVLAVRLTDPSKAYFTVTARRGYLAGR